MLNEYLAEAVGLKTGFLGDLNTGQSTSYIGLDKGYRLAVVIDVASHASDLDITFKQATSAAGAGVKDLVVNNAYFVKAGAATSFTKKDSPAAANIVEADLNAAAGILVVEVLAEDLDRNNAFTHVKVDIADPGGARVGHALHCLHDIRQKPAYELVL